jgi:hypothetical protein
MDDFSHVDYSRTLTAQEKGFYFYRFHLASRKRNRCCKVVVIHDKGPICQRFPIDHYKEGRLTTEFDKLLYER